MKEALKVRVWDRYIVVPKLLGATFILISVIMLVYTSINAFTAYDHVKDVRACVASAQTVAQYSVCVQKGMAAGVYVYTPKDFDPEQTAVPTDELWSAILPQLSWWLFWLAVFVMSIVVYRLGKFMIPVEESVAMVPVAAPTAEAPKQGAKQEEKPKTTTRRRTRKTKTTRSTRSKKK
ncbi:MAG: hypothetical protein GXN93_05460 [Candidatus Diapherotrites archaeon]|nr:hypothetical protein [Candidatus Diapherotrites archaeon]